MSCDFGIWPSELRLSTSEARNYYSSLCDGVTTAVIASAHIDAFYQELTLRHPEIDDVAEDQLDDHDLCPWSCAFDRSEGHIIICSVWSKAEYVEQLLVRLALKHNLAIYNPQCDRVMYPDKDVPVDYFWPEGTPVVAGRWLKHTSTDRMKWLDRVRQRHFSQHGECKDCDVKVVEINGLLIDDYPSFFLVLGEAINGPAGYFGGDLDALADCMCGGFGISAPFTLVWRNHQVSKDRLSVAHWSGATLEAPDSLWNAIIQTFKDRCIALKLM